MAGAYTLGWCQRQVSSTLGTASLNGILGTAIDPRSNTIASAQSFEVTAGSPVSIRWGYNDPGNVLLTGAPTNTITSTINVWYEKQAIDLWESTATNTITSVNLATPTLDSTLTLTPTHTGTLRIFVEVQVKVTATGTVLNDINSDAGNQFGGPSETFAAGVSGVGFTYGLIRCGTPLTSFSQSSVPPVFYPTTETNTLTTTNAPRVADGTYTVSWRSAPGVGNQFATTPIPSGTVSNPTDGGLQVAPKNSFPAGATNLSWGLVFASSTLSTANSGTALPWVHFTTTPSSPGTVVRTNDAAGNVVGLEFQNVGTFDPRLRIHSHSQKTLPLVKDTPPGTMTDDTAFIISADLFKGWAFAQNNANSPQSGITFNMHLSDPSITPPTVQTASTGLGDNVATLGPSDGTGWVPGAGFVAFTPSPPGGNWHFYTANATDGSGSTWSGAFIIRDERNPETSGAFNTLERLGFGSAYTADQFLMIGTPGFLNVGVAQKILAQYIKQNGVRIAFDSAPSIRIYTINTSTGAEIDTVALALMSQVGTSNVWSFTWTPPANNLYVVEIRGVVAGGGVQGAIAVSVPFNSFDAVDFVTGFPFK